MTDDHIQQQVEDALDWADPSVDGSRIGVTVDGGVVTLRGSVDTRSQKATAERVAMLVRGVNAVVNDLAVRPVAGLEPTDMDIAQTAVKALNEVAVARPNATAGDLGATIEAEVLRTGETDIRGVHVNVLGGRVILSGHVHSWFEREEARRAASTAPGVTAVVDQLAVVP